MNLQRWSSPELDFIARKPLDEWLLERLQKDEQLRDRDHREPRRPDFPFVVDLVPVATPDPGLGQVARFLEIVDDLSGRSFRDAHVFGDVSQARIRVGSDTCEHVTVVRHQAPKRIRVSGT